MSLKHTLSQQGQFLFRWRSYLPVLFAVPLTVAFSEVRWPFGNHEIHRFWELVCLGCSLTGLAFRIHVIGHAPQGTSGRNTTAQVAETINQDGLYSVVRHPLYVGNFLIGLGLMLMPLIWWLPILYILAFALYYERIMMAEEEFLHRKFGDEFERWAACTPAFLPRWSQWSKPRLPFSLRNVLRREYTAVAQITIVFVVAEMVEHWIVEHRVVVEPFWAVVGILGVAQYLVLRSLKRHTNLLYVQGR